MLITFNLTEGKKYFYNLPDERHFNDLLRNIKGTKERGESFIQLNKQFVKGYDAKGKITEFTGDVWINVTSVISMDITASTETPVVPEVDESNLLAARTFVNLEGDALKAAQLEKQPMLADIAKANEREENLRSEQGLPGAKPKATKGVK